MAEDKKQLLNPNTRASFTNPKLKKVFGLITADADGERLLTLSDVGGKEPVFDIREWSYDRTRADKFGQQIAQDDIADYAYVFAQFLSTDTLIAIAASRGLMTYPIPQTPTMQPMQPM